MAENQIIKDILLSYDEIQLLGEEDDIIFFKLKDKEYGVWYSKREHRTSKPIILVRNDNQYDYPHILPFEIPIDKDKQNYRSVCLYESGNIISYLMSYEEKIIDAIV